MLMRRDVLEKNVAINGIVEKIKQFWPFPEPLVTMLKDHAVRAVLYSVSKMDPKLNIDNFLFWTYFVDRFNLFEPPYLQVIFSGRRRQQYRKFLGMVNSNQKVQEIINIYYKKFPENRKYGIRGYFKTSGVFSQYTKYPIEEIEKVIKSTHELDSAPWVILRPLAGLSNEKHVKQSRGSWSEEDNQKQETERIYKLLEEASGELLLSDRGRKMLLTKEEGRQALQKFEWCKDFWEEHKDLIQGQIKLLIAEYDACKSRKERYKLLEKYDPNVLDPAFDEQYLQRKEQLMGMGLL